jgi:hypothetical protein
MPGYHVFRIIELKGILLYLPIKITRVHPLFRLIYVKIYFLCFFCFLLPTEIAMAVKAICRYCCRAAGHDLNPKCHCFLNYMNKLQLIDFNVFPSLKLSCFVL